MKFDTYPVTLRQLQYMIAVGEELNFRKAAERCHVSQPSLSAQVAELERTLGVQLFERDRRKVRLTRAGRALIERGRTVLTSLEDFVTTSRLYTDPFVGILRIGVIPTVSPYLLPDLDPILRSAFPRLSLRWLEDKTESLVHAVEGGGLDAALLAVEADIGTLDHEPILQDPFVLALPLDHELAASSLPVEVAELASHSVLLLDEGHCFRDQALDVCSSVGAREESFRATSLSTLVQMVSGGRFITLLPRMAIATENRYNRLRIRPLVKPMPTRTIAIAWRRHSPYADALGTLARTSAAALAAKRTDTSP